MWPLLVLCILLCTWFLTYWVMRSLQNLQNTFQKIDLKGNGNVSGSGNALSEKQFDVEFASFVGYFNSLIKRLQLNFEQASRFSSDAAHELRTPLTVIRGNLKRLLNRAQDNSVEQIQLSMLSDEVERLISITNKLVLLSQADGDNFKLDLQEIKLFDLIEVTG
jgi:signal transduction histidine kinase